MKIGMVIYSNDPETVWNAFRFGTFALKNGDSVKAFMLAKGVECDDIDTDDFKVNEQIQTFISEDGEILACGTCLKLRQSDGSGICPLSSMKDFYEMVRESDKVITF